MIRKASEMREQIREEMRGGTGAVLFRHCFEPDEFAAKVRLCAKLTLAPGCSIGPHGHEKEDEIYIVTRGSGLLDDGEKKTLVSEGDAVLTGRGTSHAIANAGDTDLEFIAVIICYPE